MSTKQNKQDKGTGTSGNKGAAAAVVQPSKITSLVRYFENSRTELGKVSWPTRKEVKTTSLAVLVMVVVMALFLGLVDWIFSWVMQIILGMGA